MALIATTRKGLKGSNVGSVITRAQRNVGQSRLSATPLVQEDFLDANGPSQGVEHADVTSQAGQSGIKFGQRRGAHGGLFGRQGVIDKRSRCQGIVALPVDGRRHALLDG
ncbi:hypothetical protein D3C72_1787290 [compost metagenome]